MTSKVPEVDKGGGGDGGITGTTTQFNMRIAKVFNDNKARVNAMSFHEDGKLLAVSSDDGTLHVYNTMTASEKKNIYCKKYGIDLVRYTRNESSVISASHNGWDGHRDRVTSLSLSPVSSIMVSTSLDGTTRVWDTSMPKCQGHASPRQNPVAAFDPTGQVLAIISDTPNHDTKSNNMLGIDVYLYDIRNYERGSFKGKSLELSKPCEGLYSCVSAQFSNDGKNILISTDRDSLFLVDGYMQRDDIPVRELSCRKDHRMTSLVHPTFSPDDKRVIAGTDDGALVVWDVSKNDLRVEENVFLSNPMVVSAHQLPINVVSYNPKYDMFASACSCVGFWLPMQSFP